MRSLDKRRPVAGGPQSRILAKEPLLDDVERAGETVEAARHEVQSGNASRKSAIVIRCASWIRAAYGYRGIFQPR